MATEFRFTAEKIGEIVASSLPLDLNEAMAAIGAPALTSAIEVSDRSRVQSGDDVRFERPKDSKRRRKVSRHV